ncbi:MAG: Ig-like domain-containing protein [Rhodocyclaceae bacterium]|nr:Ig-like domain-containing protein [Rhodocyclaceae bacterium]
MKVTPATLSLATGASGVFSVANPSGAVSVSVSDKNIASASYASGKVTVTGLKAGSITVKVKDSKTELTESVTVAAPVVPMTVTPALLSLTAGNSGVFTVANPAGAVSVSVSNSAIASASYASGKVTVKALKAGSATVTIKDSKTTLTEGVFVTASTTGGGGGGTGGTVGSYALLAWNDLGMHCVDGKDYSVFSILPPYNNLHAQLVNTSTNKQVTSGVTLTYESMADPTGSINTISSTKTNFWQYVQAMFGASVAPDVGLKGNPTASKTPAKMTWNATQGWFEAEGIPITPYDDAGVKNFYPMVKVVAKDSTGKVLASAQAVLPVSDEMTCKSCHTSTNTGNAAQVAAKPPTSGWAFDPDAEKDWKKNILRLHDDKKLSNPAFTAALAKLGFDARGLVITASLGKPILCAACHGSNALPGTGVAGISMLTSAMHTKHSQVTDPVQLLKLDDIANRSSCYTCHPGSVTKCLRGAMGNAVDASGNATMGCQSCHGTMAAVGNPARTGWLQQPNCQACHHDGVRETSAVTTAGILRAVTDTRFATVANTPAAGFSLFRFSKGHGNLQCEACHGATHAEYPSSHTNDNLQSISLQGHAGTVHECTACHATVPNTTNGGPHGMHTIGQAWVSGHESAAKAGTAACATCHGATFRGSPLSQVKTAKSLTAESKTVAYKAGQPVTCYDCHNGPNGG